MASAALVEEGRGRGVSVSPIPLDQLDGAVSDDENMLSLPQFTNQVPNIPPIDHQELEDVEAFLETLEKDLQPRRPAMGQLGNGVGVGPGLTKQDAATIKQQFQSSAQSAMESLQKLKEQKEDLYRTASNCKKVLARSVESRREATEAIKQLSSETARVLDDDVPPELLATVETSLTNKVNEISHKDSTTTVSVKAATTIKNGLELQKNGSRLKVIYHDKGSDTELTVLLNQNSDQIYEMETSHRIEGLQGLLDELHSSSDWPKFYMSLRKAFSSIQTSSLPN